MEATYRICVTVWRRDTKDTAIARKYRGCRPHMDRGPNKCARMKKLTNYKFKIGDYFELTDPLFSPEGRGVMVEKVTDDIGRQHPES